MAAKSQVSCDNCNTLFMKINYAIKITKHNFCNKQCMKEWKDNKELPDATLAEVKYTNHHPSAAFAFVRYRALIVARKQGWTKCAKCDYSRHFEVAHIKPISSFPETTMISVVNDPSNLLPLCPNCHWEFDNLKVGPIPCEGT